MIQAIQIVIGGVLQGAVFALLALGFSLVYRVTGVINLAQGGFCVFGALLMYTLQVSWGLPIWRSKRSSYRRSMAFSATSWLASVGRRGLR